MTTRSELILDFSKKHFVLIMATLFFAVMGSMLNILLPLSIGKFYEIALHENSLKGRLFNYLPVEVVSGNQFFLFFAAVILLAGVTVFFHKYFAGVIGEKFSKEIRELAFSTQLKQPMHVFEEKPAGKYLLRYSGDLIFIQKFITTGIIEFTADLIFLSLAFMVLFSNSSGLTLIVFSILLIGFFIIYLFTAGLRNVIVQRRNSKSALLGFVANRFQSFISLKAFNREKPEEEQFNSRSKKIYDFGLKYFRRYSFVQTLLPVLFYTAVGIVLYDVMILRETKPYGIRKADVFAYILILLYMQRVFKRILSVNIVWRAGTVSYNKLLNVINRPVEPQTVIENYDSIGKIEMKNISFSYKEGKNIFNQFSFKANENSLTIIEGDAGTGKSTLLKLLTNLYPVNTGEILIDDYNYSFMTPKLIRKNVTIVGDDFPLTGNTVFKAVSYSRSFDKREKAISSLQQLKFNSDENADAMLNEKLTDFACNLSYTERKMLMFSRALLTRKKVLLLDEPFKGLDETNRVIITERINKLRSKRTIIIAASDEGYRSLQPDQVISLNTKNKLI